MKLNAHTALHTPTATLLPYSPHHVPKYHTWMQSPTLRALTASEPLSLAQEHAMQQSWRHDGDKLTFVVCTPRGAGETHTGSSEDQEDEINRRVGDVNVFFYQDDDDDDGNDDEGNETASPNPDAQLTRPLIAELEIMIADPAHRGKGLATAALQAMLWYLYRHIDALIAEYIAFTQSEASTGAKLSPPASQNLPSLTHLRAKIAADNSSSVRLFSRLGFTLVNSGAPNYFNEVEMRMGREELRSSVQGLGVREVRYEC